MKRWKKIVLFFTFFILALILNPTNLNAKTVLMTCEYKYDPGQLGYWATVKLEIHTDYSHQAWLSRMADNQNNKEDVLNWTSAFSGTSFVGKTFVQNNNTCPLYAAFVERDDWGTSWELYLVNSDEEYAVIRDYF